MTEKKCVYVVTAGHYSDYRICGVFDDRVLAEGFVTIINDGETRVEDWILNSHETEIRAGGYKKYFVRMKRDGDTLECYGDDGPYGLAESDEPCGFDCKGDMYLYALAKDIEHAVKIANERRTQLIATGGWKK